MCVGGDIRSPFLPSSSFNPFHPTLLSLPPAISLVSVHSSDPIAAAQLVGIKVVLTEPVPVHTGLRGRCGEWKCGCGVGAWVLKLGYLSGRVLCG